MDFLKNLGLILCIVLPLLFILLAILARKKFTRNTKFRRTLLTLIIASFILPFSFYNLASESENNEKEKLDNTEEVEEVLEETETDEETVSNEFKIETIDGVTYVDGYLIVNKTYPLPSDFVPTDTYKTATSETTTCQTCINSEAYEAFLKMQSDAESLGLTLWIQSGYRSYNYQEALYNGYVNRSGKDAADTYSARAGHSEHQSGLAFDLNTITDAFADTDEGIWVNDNCYKYGFIIRYPKDKSDETGYKYESWHLRYVGVNLAEKLYNNGDWITMEAYFGLTSEYSS